MQAHHGQRVWRWDFILVGGLLLLVSALPMAAEVVVLTKEVIVLMKEDAFVPAQRRRAAHACPTAPSGRV